MIEPDAELARLVQQVAEAEAQLQAYLQGQVDSVVASDGQTILLREAQQRLLHSEAAQRRLAVTQTAVLDALPQNIAVVDSEGVITAVNAAWRHYALQNGLNDRHFCVGQNYLHACSADLREELEAVLRGERQEFAWEYPCHSPDDRRWFRLIATPLWDGGLTGAVIAHANVTERRRSEEANRIQAFMLDNIGQAVITTDLEGSIIYANRFAGELYGWSPAAMWGKNISNVVVTEADRDHAGEIMHRLQSGKAWNGEFSVRRRDGSTFIASVSNAPLTDEHGQVSGIIGISSDVSDKKLAEERLRQSEALLRLAGRMARLGWWTVDVATQTVVMSDEVCAIHEIPPGSTPTAEEATAFYAPTSAPVIWSHFQQCCLDGTPFDAELELVTAGGRHVWVRSLGAAEKDESGVVTTIQGALQDISELKRTAEENRSLAERLSTTLESITDGLCTLDRQWCYTYVNSQAERFLQKSRAALLGRCFWDEFPDTVGSLYQQKFEESLRTNLPVQFEQFYAPLGTWFDLQVYPSEQGLAIYFRDVTEQREARQAARASEERFRLLSKATQDGIWDWDIESSSLWWNEGYGTLFGYDVAKIEPVITSWRERVHPEDASRVLPFVQHILSGKETSFQIEYRFRRGDGTYAYVLDRGYVIRDESGKPVRMIGGMTDLSDRREAEEKLAQQASLLDKAQDAIMVRDLEDRFTYWNRSAERLYGYSADEARGQRCIELLHLDHEAYRAANQRLLTTGEWAGEFSKKTRDGRVCSVESRWTLVRDDAGQPRSVLVIDTDVTERKKLEQQFLRAQRMESIGTLAGGIAHDLNNILAPIMLSIPLLRWDEEDADRLDTLDTIAESARRGADMVQQVLSFARGVEGKRESVDVAELLAGIQKIVNDTFLKNVQVRSTVQPSLPALCGDSTQLHQVLLNLCVNARDAMPQGGTLLLSAALVECDEQYATLQPDAKPGAYVRIDVKDSGVGMPAGVLDKIFEPFFTTKELGQGTGLGLSTSVGIVKSHGGFIQVESRPALGTTFSVYLPCPEHSLRPNIPQAPAPTPHGHGELILIVDDEPAVRQITQKTLQAYGYRTLVAGDGVEGLSLYADNRDAISVILTDIMMPLLDGPTMVQALLKINPRVRVIGVSGVTADKGALSGLRKFLNKPYTAETLIAAIADVIAAES